MVAGWDTDEPCPGEALPPLDQFGTPTVTPTPTPTTFATPTLYPTATAGAPPLPTQTLCADRTEQWIKDLCLQGWNYLDTSQQASLEQVLPTLGTDFISLDAWWLQNYGRGIMDVPPKIWQYDSLQQCASYLNRTGCEQIVHDSIYLFNNMGRIGVDWADLGLGQTQYGDIATQELWYLGEAPANFSSTYWGWVQGVDYACDTNRFGVYTAEVCWVCQDVPTILYDRIGYSLENQMLPVKDFWNEAYHRYVPSVVYFANWAASTQNGNPVLSGDNPAYRIGENVSTSTIAITGLPSLQMPTDYLIFNHVGIAVRGAELGMTIEEALDYVLIAQISYSSQGFFLSSSDDSTNGELNISPDGYTGRYEVITLRTYLYKHLRGLENPIPLVDSVILANNYLRHWSPSELSLDYSN